MRVLLIVPPFYRLWGGRNNWVSVGPAVVAASLISSGIDAKVYNADHVEGGQDPSLREVFDSTERPTVVDDLSHFLWDEIQATVADYNPDVVGFSIAFTPLIHVVNIIARSIKERWKDMLIVAGGSTATLLPEDVIVLPDIDYVFRGEGEYALTELLQGAPPETIPGLSYRNDEGVSIHNPDRELIQDLDEVPWPSFELQSFQFNPKRNFGVLSTSRGCSYCCTFCSSPVLWRDSVRYRSAKNVVDEMLYRHINYGVNKFYFSDDNFNLNRTRVHEFCTLLREHRDNHPFSWVCEAQLKTTDHGTLELMKDVGCKRLKLGVESGCNRILQMMRKGITKEKIREKIDEIKDVGIDFTTHILIGMPTETKEEMLETYEFVKELGPTYVSLSIVTPQPGTQLLQQVKDLRLFSEMDFYTRSHQSYHSTINPNVDREIVEKFLQLNEGKTREI